MLSAICRRFKSDSSFIGNDLNKKILEAFNSIIDKGTKSSVIRKEPTVEPIARYNVDSRNTVVKIQDYKGKISAISDNEPILVRNSPDIFKRNKMSPQFLHKDVYLMSKMLTPSGSILPKSLTKLTSKIHRHMSKAIRRARQMGILPYMYRPKSAFKFAHACQNMYSEPGWSQATTKYGFLEIMKEGKIIEIIPIPCGKKVFTFGRLPENSVPLDHESISRKHAVLQFGPRDSAFIYDLGSSHGTFVNKKQIPAGQYVKIASKNAIIRFGVSSRYYILNLEENANEESTIILPKTKKEFRAAVSSFFSEHGISIRTIEFTKALNLFSCTLDFSEYVSIDSSEPSRITSSGSSKEEALDNFYEDSYSFLSRLKLIDVLKNNLNSDSDSDISNEDFYNYDQMTANDSKLSNRPLTENEVITLRNSSKSRMENIQTNITKLLVQLDYLEHEVVDDFDVFVQNLKKDELKKDIEKCENMHENIKNEFSKYQNILAAIGYKDTHNKLWIENKVESKPIDNPVDPIKHNYEDDKNNNLKPDSKRNKTTNEYIKNVSDMENESNDSMEERVDFEDSTLHDEQIDLIDLKIKYGY